MFDCIDFILNLAALLLWLNWRSVRFDPFLRGTPATLAGTVRRAEPLRLKRWHFLAALGVLLFARTFFYWVIGPEVDWVPKLDLTFVEPAFRGRAFLPVLLFSVLSFLRVLVVFYSWLLAIAILNRRVAEPDPIQKLVLLQLGRAARWPWPAQALWPLLAGAALWIALHPALTHLGVTNPVRSYLPLLGQGLLVGSAIYLSLKFLLPALLLAHLVSSYIYFGRSPVWDFVSITARNVVQPLRFLRLRFGKVDLAPVAGIILVLLLLHALPKFLLGELARRQLTLWPM